MDQAFSIKNLSLLMKEDRKKGGDLEERFIPKAFEISLRLSKLKKLYSSSRYRVRTGAMSSAFFERRLARINNVIEKRRAQHESLVDAELERVSQVIISKTFRIDIFLLPSLVAGKKVYGVGNSLDQILAVRFVQKTLKAIYEINMPARDTLVSQIKSLVLDGVPKYIIRSDVESFYESVQHQDLLEEIHKSPKLSVLIKRILTRLMKDYLSVSGDSKGLPRGIGISAYLSEIYLSSIDAEIRRQDDLFYYARYVDDMVLMYSPDRNESAGDYLSNLEKILGRKGLVLNRKTKVIDLLDKQKGNFDYLGYSFDASSSSPGVRLSNKRLQRYRSRLDKAFTDYQAKRKFIPAVSEEELILRCLFLTGNMRLFNRKSNAFIGIYYSNKYITETSQLHGLDRYYYNKIAALPNMSLRRKLLKLSFERGYKEKLFRNFSFEQISELSQGWKHV